MIIGPIDDGFVTDDQHLKKYFKERYGIDLSSAASELTEEERETLR